MNVLFLHSAFPAQFGRLALELTRRYGWSCRFLVESYSACPTPSPAMLEALEIRKVVPSAGPKPKAGDPWPRVFGRWIEQCRDVRREAEALGGPPPDLVVAHGGQGAPIAFLREVIDAPIINYCEYYFPDRYGDLTYRVDLPPASEIAPFYPRCINAPVLMAMLGSDAGYAPTRFQRDTFPERFRSRIEVHFDGIDTEQYRPRTLETLTLPDGRRIGPETKVVTYVARGLESMRGFDLFVRVADRIARERSDVLFVAAGSETTYYGWDNHHTGSDSFRRWTFEQTGADPSRFVFLGHVTPEVLADVLARSDLHLYPSVPFVPSWSLFNALASGAVVIGSDTAPVRELIEPGRNGLIAPLFDRDGWAELALGVLDDPAGHAALGRAAAETIAERYSLDTCVPALRTFFEQIAG